MKLLCEELNPKVEYGTAGKQHYIEGIFAQAEVVNGNNRVYPHDVLMSQVESYIDTHVKKGRAMGELEHPVDRVAVDSNLASHRIVDLRIEGNNVIGKALILDTATGKNAKALLEGGVQLGVSTRGLASILENKYGVSEVQDDFRLITVDIVGTPSAPDAYVNGVLESMNFHFDKTGKLIAESEEELTHKRIEFIKAALKAFR